MLSTISHPPCCREVIQKQTATVQRGISVKRVQNEQNQPMMTTMGDALRGLIVLREPLPLLLVLLANSGMFIFIYCQWVLNINTVIDAANVFMDKIK